jgi:hypothetical protein
MCEADTMRLAIVSIRVLVNGDCEERCPPEVGTRPVGARPALVVSAR